jgi:hypothetical protein
MSTATSTTTPKSTLPLDLRDLQRALTAVRDAISYPAGADPASLEDGDQLAAEFVWALTAESVIGVLIDRLLDFDPMASRSTISCWVKMAEDLMEEASMMRGWAIRKLAKSVQVVRVDAS